MIYAFEKYHLVSQLVDSNNISNCSSYSQRASIDNNKFQKKQTNIIVALIAPALKCLHGIFKIDHHRLADMTTHLLPSPYCCRLDEIHIFFCYFIKTSITQKNKIAWQLSLQLFSLIRTASNWMSETVYSAILHHDIHSIIFFPHTHVLLPYIFKFSRSTECLSDASKNINCVISYL